MLVFSARFNKKRAITTVVAIAAVLAIIVLLAGRRDAPEAQAAFGAIVKDNAERLAYLKALGWEVEEMAMEEQAIIIPRELNEVYTEYNKIQTAQGFDLSKFGGAEAMRYTYRILNYPEENVSAVADIIVYRNEIIAGDVQSNKLDGFMTGLRYPEK